MTNKAWDGKNRPLDIHGQPVDLGPWYWGIGRTGRVAGTGKFLAIIGNGDVHFYINGTGYDARDFTYERAVEPLSATPAPQPPLAGQGEWIAGPTAPGWYWFRKYPRPGWVSEIKQLVLDERCGLLMDGWSPKSHLGTTDGQCRWLGPIEPPRYSAGESKGGANG